MGSRSVVVCQPWVRSWLQGPPRAPGPEPLPPGLLARQPPVRPLRAIFSTAGQGQVASGPKADPISELRSSEQIGRIVRETSTSMWRCYCGYDAGRIVDRRVRAICTYARVRFGPLGSTKSSPSQFSFGGISVSGLLISFNLAILTDVSS